MNKPLSEHPKLLLDPYARLDRQGRRADHRGFRHRLSSQIPTAPWPRFGVDGAIVHLKGRGDFVSIFVLDLAPGAQTVAAEAPLRGGRLRALGPRQHHGRDRATAGSTASNGARRACSRCRSTPATSTSTPRAASARGSPRPTISAMMLNLFHNEAFVFDNPYAFPERQGARQSLQRRRRVHAGAARPQHVGDELRPRPRGLRAEGLGRSAAPAAPT